MMTFTTKGRVFFCKSSTEARFRVYKVGSKEYGTGTRKVPKADLKRADARCRRESRK